MVNREEGGSWPVRFLSSVGSVPAGYPRCLRCPTALVRFRYPIPSLFCLLFLLCCLSLVAAVLPLSAASSLSSLLCLCCTFVWRGALSARPAPPFRFFGFSLLPPLFCRFVMKRVMLVCSVLSRLCPCFSLASLLVFCRFVCARCHCFVIVSQCAVVFLSCCAARFLRLCSCAVSLRRLPRLHVAGSYGPRALRYVPPQQG